MSSRLMTLVSVLALGAAQAAQGARWLRVAQREHYISGASLLFCGRWTRQPRQLTLSLFAVLLAVGLFVVSPRMGTWIVVAYAVVSPLGLSLRGRTSPLAWTRRLKRLTATAAMFIIAAIIGAVLLGRHSPRVGWVLVCVTVLATPLFIDAAAALNAPIERRLAQPFVDRASARLRKVNPRIVAVTGSYGKTSTKHHIAEILGASSGVVPTPRSFNNRAGLSRAINENLVEGTKVFIAEMGTYGPGEIADLCAWCPPEIAVVTAIGPVHLERMKSLETIESAKFEITEHAATVIVNADDERLRQWVARLVADGKKVITAGTTEACNVAVIDSRERWQILRDGVQVAEVLPVAGVRPSNVACALAVAFELGLDVYDIATRVGHLTPPQHRLTVVRAPSGLTIIDDTFNANPASSVVALEALLQVPVSGRRVVVTPGLVELGTRQREENRLFGRRVRDAHCELVVVASTNATALREGFSGSVVRCATREEAVGWVRENLSGEDAVLYLNDLPDHYP